MTAQSERSASDLVNMKFSPGVFYSPDRASRSARAYQRPCETLVIVCAEICSLFCHKAHTPVRFSLIEIVSKGSSAGRARQGAEVLATTGWLCAAAEELFAAS